MRKTYKKQKGSGGRLSKLRKVTVVNEKRVPAPFLTDNPINKKVKELTKEIEDLTNEIDRINNDAKKMEERKKSYEDSISKIKNKRDDMTAKMREFVRLQRGKLNDKIFDRNLKDRTKDLQIEINQRKHYENLIEAINRNIKTSNPLKEYNEQLIERKIKEMEELLGENNISPINTLKLNKFNNPLRRNTMKGGQNKKHSKFRNLIPRMTNKEIERRDKLYEDYNENIREYTHSYSSEIERLEDDKRFYKSGIELMNIVIEKSNESIRELDNNDVDNLITSSKKSIDDANKIIIENKRNIEDIDKKIEKLKKYKSKGINYKTSIIKVMNDPKRGIGINYKVKNSSNIAEAENLTNRIWRDDLEERLMKEMLAED